MRAECPVVAPGARAIADAEQQAPSGSSALVEDLVQHRHHGVMHGAPIIGEKEGLVDLEREVLPSEWPRLDDTIIELDGQTEQIVHTHLPLSRLVTDAAMPQHLAKSLCLMS